MCDVCAAQAEQIALLKEALKDATDRHSAALKDAEAWRGHAWAARAQHDTLLKNANDLVDELAKVHPIVGAVDAIRKAEYIDG